jgi:hypothetical protein
LNCEQANQLDMVDYLLSLGFSPVKISGENYLYLSPFREENTASFKVNRTKNIWYDHGVGKGGNLVDFACIYFHCNLTLALQKINENPAQKLSSFHQQKTKELLPEAQENTIRILSVRSPINDMVLNRYLKQRNIPRLIANEFCKEVLYQTGDKRYTAIGFKNNSGGYELRNEYFKGSSSPKYVTYFDNKANNITCFEGFFDFLTYLAIHHNQELPKTNILILNSLSYFTRSLLLMEKHEKVHLYLDNDNAGRKCVDQALSRSKKISDESGLYKGYKDLNEWSVSFGKQQRLEHRNGLRP